MDFEISEEREQLRDAVRKFLQARSATTDVRRTMVTEDGYDHAVWAQMSEELGLQGINIAEEYGGQGFTFVELGIVLEEMGRALLCAPFFSTVCLAANAIANVATAEQRAELLPLIATGRSIATLAFAESNGRWGPDGILMEAHRGGDDWTLSGTKTFVMDGHVADTVVVVARLPGTSGPEGLTFFEVDGGAPGLSRTLLPTMDATRKQARLDFDATPARVLGPAGQGWPAFERTMNQAAVCLSNEMVGGAQRVLEMAVEYAKDRWQFGRPIGSFQAIKHKCADMLVDVELAKSTAYFAAMSAAEDGEDLAVNASLAKAFCSDSYFRAAAENIQIHGGIGFTWEHDAHLYFKRAKTSQLMLGDATYHREQLAKLIGI